MEITCAELSLIVNALGATELPYGLQELVVKGLLATPAQLRAFALNRRDAAIRELARRFYGDVSRNQAAVLIAKALDGVSPPSHGVRLFTTLNTADQFGLLTQIAEFRRKEGLTSNQVRHILAGDRTGR